MFQNIGEMVLLFWRTLVALPLAWRQRQKVFDQFFEIGNASLLMVCILSFFIGGVIALQTGPLLVERGLGSYVGGVVGYSICQGAGAGDDGHPHCRAHRFGHGGGDRVHARLSGNRRAAHDEHQPDPLPGAAAPGRPSPSPCPCWSYLPSSSAGWGAAVVCAANDRIAVSFDAFFSALRDAVDLKDVANGVFKSFVFAVTIGVVSCHQGLITRGGPRGIGRSVTKAVVNSIVLIVIFDYLLTRVLLK